MPRNEPEAAIPHDHLRIRLEHTRAGQVSVRNDGHR
ncbi:hypothetical protein PHA8399_04102 [Leisingera aquaemixtae]|uniref:Uncharacterized protein n=1 Tax=Leisingera aquaemixtae TaxID=1396826 RepID=A0A0N7M5B2_9RHOB|nr:hypothetical protein PHA8399_04102 [Leisingera aquaemixtae]